MPQTADAEEILYQVYNLDSVKENQVHLKVYGMTRAAFERAANCAQKGYPPHSVTFTISAEDLHGRRNSGRTREEYWDEIPEFCRIAKENGFKVDCAIASAYGSAMAGPVPIENTIEIIDRALDMGIRDFTPCDSTGESNPLRSFLYMAALVDKYSKYVIKNLIDIKGKSQSDVANFIIKDWIGDHQIELKEYGISVNNAKKEGKI
jgi:hydroxymethylglutaryl-CoA lyase